jgi:hypothetical protein
MTLMSDDGVEDEIGAETLSSGFWEELAATVARHRVTVSIYVQAQDDTEAEESR